MNTELVLLTTFFGVVMAAILCVGYGAISWLNRSRKVASGEAPSEALSFDDDLMPASKKILARTFHAFGESVLAAKQDNEPLRKRLMMDIRLGSLLRDCIVVLTEDIPSSCGMLV